MHIKIIGLQSLAVISLATMLACFAGCATLGQPAGVTAVSLPLIENDKSNATIVVGVAPSAQAKQAAEELRTFLKKMTGVELSITNGTADSPVNILVGQSAARDQAAAIGLMIPAGLNNDFNDEGYVIATGRDFLILAGNEAEPYEGTYYAVYDFLHSQGCRWYMPSEFGEVIPTLSTVIAKPARRIIKPVFRVRDAWYSGYYPPTQEQAHDFAKWKRRNRYCRPGFWGSDKYLGNPGDDTSYRLLPKDTYWVTHPEYYCLNEDGSRNDRFFCMSNPGALGAATKTVITQFADHPDNHTFVFSPPDGYGICHCPECKLAMHDGFGREGYGELSEPYFRFVFELADRVRQHYPNKYVSTMAYANRCRPPEGINGKRDNLLIQLASIQQCTLHSYASKDCPTRHIFLTMLKRWSQLAAGLVIYEYDPRDWSSLQLPLWRTLQMADDMRTLKKVDGWGISVEGKMDWLSSGMSYYLRGLLSWDLTIDPVNVEADFCQRFFGPSAEPMLDYYRAISRSAWHSHVHVIAANNISSIWPRPLLDNCKGMLEQAERLAINEPYKTRVAAFRGHFDRLDAFCKMREALARADYNGAAQFAQHMIDAVNRVNNNMLLQDAQRLNQDELSGTKQKQYCQKLSAWFDGLNGDLLVTLPSDALFRTDPVSEGVIARWYLPDIDLSAWQPIRMTTDWWSQGVAGPNRRSYEGIAWYRCGIMLPESLPSRIELYFPGLHADGIWVWCNGMFAGYMAYTNENEPSCINVSNALRPGENIIVLRIKGKTGITLPPFLLAKR